MRAYVRRTSSPSWSRLWFRNDGLEVHRTGRRTGRRRVRTYDGLLVRRADGRGLGTTDWKSIVRAVVALVRTTDF
ncbi:MAG: hypothetical protein ACKOUR_10280 [Planctomycetota bacterium]